MSSITRRALRVYAALSELQPGQQDVLDAILPFFEPILEKMDGRLFEPKLFALGVRKVYRWRFTADIAAKLTPRLVRAGYLEQVVRRGSDTAYLVKFKNKNNDDTLDAVLKEIIDEFEAFSPRLSDLLHYRRSREELTDILIRFLVSLDAYNPATFEAELKRIQLDAEDTRILAELDEGGEPLASDDKYMAARFVQHICEHRKDAVPNLARLAAIGLLTEVVEDFVKPISIEAKSSLTVVVDAPLALDFLGCSGKTLKDDVKIIFDALQGIGCNLVVFPITCDEVRRNLTSMLSLPETRRHGYTHEAILKREVTPEYVRAVANDPQHALQRAGITVLPLDLRQRPDTHRYFTDEQYEDYISAINWVRDVAPREHDACCLALTMRLRSGRHSGDIFQCGYVFATRNPRFVQHSRQYCLESRLLYETQENPVIHQRELATVAWLRTGLGVSERIPRGQLLAACDRVLRVRTEVRDAVASRLREFTPEKVDEFELLISDHRSLRRLADQTLNNENVVTADNVPGLLETMRQATIEEEKRAFEKKLAEEREKHRKLRGEQIVETERARAQTSEALTQRNAAIDAALSLQKSRLDSVRGIAKWTSGSIKTVSYAGTGVVLLVALCAVVNYWTGWLDGNPIWSIGIAALFGAFGLYNGVMDALEKPKVGLASILNVCARRLFVARLSNALLSDLVDLDKVCFKGGQIEVPPEAIKRRADYPT